MVDGTVELTVGDGNPIELGPGDSAHYRADVPHSFRNVGKGEARFIGVDATQPLDRGDRCQLRRPNLSHRRGDPRRVPDLRECDVSQLVLAGRAVDVRARGGRAVARGWDSQRRRMGLLGGAQRGVPYRGRRRPARGARRRRGHDLRLAGRERARLRAATRRRPEPHRDQRVRVPDGRADRARPGSCAAPRSSGRHGRGRDEPTGAIRGGDRRADGARLLHDALLPVSHRHDVAAIARPPGAGRRLVLATAIRPAAPSSSMSAGSAPTSSRAAPSSTSSGRPGSGSCGCGPRSTQRSAHADRLVRRRGHLRDVDRDYSPHRSARRFDSGPPVPALYAGVAGVALVERAGVAAIEAHVRALADRLLDGLDQLGDGRDPRDPRAAAARLRPLDRRERPRRGAGRRADRRLDARGQAARRAPPLQRRGGRRSPHRRRRHRALLA